MKNRYLLCLLQCFIFCSIYSQKATIDLKDGFEHINLNGKRIEVKVVEYDTYAIVTEGIPSDGMYFNLINGLLDIHVTKKDMDGKESLVILYPKGKQVPKIVDLSEWVAIERKD